MMPSREGAVKPTRTWDSEHLNLKIKETENSRKTMVSSDRMMEVMTSEYGDDGNNGNFEGIPDTNCYEENPNGFQREAHESLHQSLKLLFNSKLPHHQQVCAILQAIEETISEKGMRLSESAYFAALMSILERQNHATGSKDISNSIVLLLSKIMPGVNGYILKSKYRQSMELLLKCLQQHLDNTSLIRSMLICIVALLGATDATMWGLSDSATHPRRIFRNLLYLTIHECPKVRKAANDSIYRLIRKPMLPMERHPGGAIIGEFVFEFLEHQVKPDSSTSLYGLTFLLRVIRFLPSEYTDRIVASFRTLLDTSNSYISILILNGLETLFLSLNENYDAIQLARVLDSFCKIQSYHQDQKLLIPWLKMIQAGFIKMAQLDPDVCAKKLPIIVQSIMNMMLLSQEDICTTAVLVLETLIRHCISDKLIEATVTMHLKSVGDKSTLSSSPLTQIISLISSGLGYKYQPCWNLVLKLVICLLDRLGPRSDPLLGTLISTLGDLFLASEFTFKDQVKDCLGLAIGLIGPKGFLYILPLNLDLESDIKSSPRPWLLPILKDHVYNTTLAHFREVMIPLAARMKHKAEFFEKEGKDVEYRVYRTIYEQIWSLLPGYCSYATDAVEEFPKFFEDLMEKVNQDKFLRNIYLSGLKCFIDAGSRLASAQDQNSLELVRPISNNQVQAYCNLLASYREPILSTLFNLFSSIDSDLRPLTLQILKLYSTKVDATLISTYFKSCMKRLLETLTDSAISVTSREEGHLMMELALAMAPYLDVETSILLYRVVKPLLLSDDANFQKKSYKALAVLLDSEHLRPFILSHLEEIQSLIENGVANVAPSSKKDRLKCMNYMIDLLPASNMAFVASILGEIILSTKEINEKTRHTAYNLLIAIGNKMKESDLSSHANNFLVPPYSPSLTHFFKMILAGLAGSTSFMVSGTVLAINRILYKFYNEIDRSCIDDAVGSILMLLKFKDREVVKATTGFVKLLIFSAPKEFLERRLSEIIPGLFDVLSEHKHHFKERIRHLLKLLVRKFDFRAVEKFVPADHQKFLTNLRKTTNRAIQKRKERKLQSSTPNTDHDTENTDYDRVLNADQDSDSDSNFLDHYSSFSSKENEHSKGFKTNKSIADPIDFLNHPIMSNRSHLPRKSPSSLINGSEDGIQIAKDGKLYIRDLEAEEQLREYSDEAQERHSFDRNTSTLSDSGIDYNSINHMLEPRKRTREYEEVSETSDKKAISTPKMAEEDLDQHPLPKRRSKETIKDMIEDQARQYRSKKAKGDMKRPGKPDPFVYIPLNRKHQKSKQKTRNLIAAAQRGSIRGRQMNHHLRRQRGS